MKKQCRYATDYSRLNRLSMIAKFLLPFSIQYQRSIKNTKKTSILISFLSFLSSYSVSTITRFVLLVFFPSKNYRLLNSNGNYQTKQLNPCSRPLVLYNIRIYGPPTSTTAPPLPHCLQGGVRVLLTRSQSLDRRRVRGSLEN